MTAILEEADKTISQDRMDQYGKPEDSFETIARYWSIYLDVAICPKDVAKMMALFKIARMSHTPGSRDTIVDAIGYLAILGDRL